MNEIISYLVGKVADRTPSFILSRLLPPAKVARQVRVDLRGNNAVTLDLDGENPQAGLWLEVTNLSNLTLTLDRLLVDVWFAQPTIEGVISKRYVVPPREIVTDIYYRQSLTPGQKTRIESCLGRQGQIYIHLTAYFETKVGVVEVDNRIERSKI
jgi:hypothetical protein